MLAATLPLAPANARPIGGVQTLSPPVDDWLAEAGLTADEVAIAIRKLDPKRSGAPAYALNASLALNPASTMKLVTTWAALTRLGPDYRWRTTAFLRGRLDHGVLHGDLVLRGGGDPKFVIEDLAEWILRMRQAGLHEIRGDLIIDDSIYEPVDPAAVTIDGDASQPYNVAPWGALMNFKATRLIVRTEGASVLVTLDPALSDVQLENRIRAVRGACRHGASGLRVTDASGPVATSIRVEGQYSLGCGEQGLFAAVLDHLEFARAFFAGAWRAAGGVWNGKARIERGGALGDPWLEWVSPRTLIEVIDDVNHFSNNVMTRQLLLHLAAADGVRPARLVDARKALVAQLDRQGLRFPELVIDNGSGLSRRERISAEHLVNLLDAANASVLGERFRQSLPRAGESGTMRFRLNGDPVAGRAWIKTGSLADVRSMAGYLEAHSGRRYALAVLVNGPRAARGAALQDRLLRWLHANG